MQNQAYRKQQLVKVKLNYDSYTAIRPGDFVQIEEQLINESGDGYIVGTIEEVRLKNMLSIQKKLNENVRIEVKMQYPNFKH